MSAIDDLIDKALELSKRGELSQAVALLESIETYLDKNCDGNESLKSLIAIKQLHGAMQLQRLAIAKNLIHCFRKLSSSTIA
jgi:hypothetical protein